MEFDRSKVIIRGIDKIDDDKFYFFARTGGEIKRVVTADVTQYGLGSEILKNKYEQFLYPADTMVEKHLESELNKKLKELDKLSIEINDHRKELGQIFARLCYFPKKVTKASSRIHIENKKDNFFLVYDSYPTKAKLMECYWRLKSRYESEVDALKKELNNFDKIVIEKNKIKGALNEYRNRESNN